MPFRKITALYRKELQALGYRGPLSSDIVERFMLLDRASDTLRDQRRIADMIRLVVQELWHAGYPVSLHDLVHATASLFFTDIGKTGPWHATPDQREVILTIFDGVELPRDEVESISLLSFAQRNFGLEWAAKVRHLENLDPGLDAHLYSRGVTPFRFREFLDLHTTWGAELLRRNGIPTEYINTAMSHHLLNGNVPQGLLTSDGTFTQDTSWGEQRYGLPELLVSLLDKYDARRNRGGQSHETAIAGLYRLSDDDYPQEQARKYIKRVDCQDAIRAVCQAMHTALA